jgi:hypothetical protein
VQNGVALTPAERLQAVVSTRASLARHVQRTILANYDDWNAERGRDFQCVAAVLVLAEKWPAAGAWPGPAGLEKGLTLETDLRPELRARLLVAFRAMAYMAGAARWQDAFRRPTRPSPIEFVGIALLLTQLPAQSLSMDEAAARIAALRANVRKKFPAQLRMNSSVLSHIVTWIKKTGVEQGKGKDETLAHVVAELEKEEKRKAAADGKAKGKKKVAEPKQEPRPEPSVSAGKRKRSRIETDDESSDERPISQSVARKKPAPSASSLSVKKEKEKPPPVKEERTTKEKGVKPSAANPVVITKTQVRKTGTTSASAASTPKVKAAATPTLPAKKLSVKTDVPGTPSLTSPALPNFQRKAKPSAPTSATPSAGGSPVVPTPTSAPSPGFRALAPPPLFAARSKPVSPPRSKPVSPTGDVSMLPPPPPPVHVRRMSAADVTMHPPAPTQAPNFNFLQQYLSQGGAPADAALRTTTTVRHVIEVSQTTHDGPDLLEPSITRLQSAESPPAESPVQDRRGREPPQGPRALAGLFQSR